MATWYFNVNKTERLYALCQKLLTKQKTKQTTTTKKKEKKEKTTKKTQPNPPPPAPPPPPNNNKNNKQPQPKQLPKETMKHRNKNPNISSVFPVVFPGPSAGVDNPLYVSNISCQVANTPFNPAPSAQPRSLTTTNNLNNACGGAIAPEPDGKYMKTVNLDRKPEPEGDESDSDCKANVVSAIVAGMWIKLLLLLL